MNLRAPGRYTTTPRRHGAGGRHFPCREFWCPGCVVGSHRAELPGFVISTRDGNGGHMSTQPTEERFMVEIGWSDNIEAYMAGVPDIPELASAVQELPAGRRLQRRGAYPLLRGDGLCRTQGQPPGRRRAQDPASSAVGRRWFFSGVVPGRRCCEASQTVSVCLCVRYRVVTNMV